MMSAILVISTESAPSGVFPFSPAVRCVGRCVLRAFRLDAKLRGCGGPERAADIGMPAAVDLTDVRNIVQQLLDSASSAPVGTTLGYPVIRRCSFSLADSP